MNTSAATPTYLLLSDQYYPGWQATIDANETHIVRANYVLRVVALPPGGHTVVFSYRPKPFYLGALISGLTLLAIAAWWLLGRRRR